jgi:hypothetical protein
MYENYIPKWEELVARTTRGEKEPAAGTEARKKLDNLCLYSGGNKLSERISQDRLNLMRGHLYKHVVGKNNSKAFNEKFWKWHDELLLTTKPVAEIKLKKKLPPEMPRALTTAELNTIEADKAMWGEL